jgi:formylglycine-generating enzyme
MTKYAVLIGNSQFPDEPDKSKLPDLHCPEKDVDGLAVVLADSNRGEFTVSALKNHASHQVLLQVQRMVKQAQADDLLLIYYSGHGKPNGVNELHLTTQDTVLEVLEATAVSVHRIYDIIATGKCKKVVIILDCCYSGAARHGFKGDIDSQLQQLNKGRGSYLVTASTELQVAHETEDYSLFTKHLIAGLATGEADKDGDGFIDMDELYDYIYSKVKTENPKQEPTRDVGDQRGKVIIAKSGKDSRKERAEKLRLLLLEFEKQHEDISEIKTVAVAIARKSFSELSSIEKQQDELLSQLLAEKLKLISFIRAWERIGLIPSNDQLIISSAKPINKPIELNDNRYGEDQYGRYFDLTVNNVTQRFRLIKAGSFLMGSPLTEPERSDDEIQHKVILTQDYWLADTACTQALWLAVMANNPARFSDNLNNPVEQVSWNDVQAFLTKLNQQIPNINARLPTESEWEYACRAGMTTPFFFGNNITPEQVNYNGDNPYNNGKKGLYRKKTIPVKSLPPNNWGLYEMHGNVWEWCADWYGAYTNKALTNPKGAKKGEYRVLRGGSWIFNARYARSADRDFSTPVPRFYSEGFRFALGQTAQ